jgi:gamma-glutamylaminecyclotransferase
MRRRLFVYGTLRRGGSNHREMGDALFLGSTRTKSRYAVHRVDGFPALIPGTQNVSGEIFQVDLEALAHLDAFEGANYVRRLVELADGTSAEAYFLADSCTADEDG